MDLKDFHQLISKAFAFQFKTFPKFLKTFRDKDRRLNLTLFLLFFLTFPHQNYYQSLQSPEGKPLVRSLDFDIPLAEKYPINKTGVKPPFINARAAVIIDVPSKTVIFSKNPDWSLHPASTTKIMTALVALETYNLDDVLTVKTPLKIGQVIGLEKGEQFTFKSLLYASLVGSGNDAAFALAENYPGGVQAFVTKMNEKARELHLEKTNFVNVTGVEAYNHKTTAHDLAILSSEALKNSFLVKVVATKEIEITDVSREHSYLLKNTNELVGKIWGVKGLKTGWTQKSGECLVTYVQRDEGEILAVLLGSQDRFGETIKLINWVFDNFEWTFTDTNYQQLPAHRQ